MNGILVRDFNRRYFSLNDLQRKILGKAEKHQTGVFFAFKHERLLSWYMGHR